MPANYSTEYWFNRGLKRQNVIVRSSAPAPRTITPPRSTVAVSPSKLTADQDIDFSTIGTNKVLVASRSNGKPFAFAQIALPIIPTLAADQDIDFSTLQPGYVLTASHSNGYPYSFASFSSSVVSYSSGSSAPTTLESLTDIDHATEIAGRVLTVASSGPKPFVWMAPASGGSGSGTIATLHTAQQAISSLIHQWRCNDAAGSTTLADSKGSSPLSVGSSAIVGVPGLLNDGATSVFLPGNGVATSYIQGLNVLPTSGAMSVEMVFELYSTAGNSSSIGIIFLLGTAASASTGVTFNFRPTEFEWAPAASDSTFCQGGLIGSYLVHLELDGLGGAYGFLNGLPLFSATSGFPTSFATPALTVGYYYMGVANYSPTMQAQNIAIYNARLTQAQKNANMNALFRR